MSESADTANRRTLRRKLSAYGGYLTEQIRRLSPETVESRASMSIAGRYIVPSPQATYVSQPLVSGHSDELKKVGFTAEDVDESDHVVWVSLRPRDAPGFLGAEQEPTWGVLTSTDTGITTLLDGYIHDRADGTGLVFVATVSESQAAAARNRRLVGGEGDG
jgi:hypothetical protein